MCDVDSKKWCGRPLRYSELARFARLIKESKSKSKFGGKGLGFGGKAKKKNAKLNKAMAKFKNDGYIDL